MTLWHFIIFLLACGAVLFGIYYVAPRLIASERVRRWLGGGKFWLLIPMTFGLCLSAIGDVRLQLVSLTTNRPAFDFTAAAGSTAYWHSSNYCWSATFTITGTPGVYDLQWDYDLWPRYTNWFSPSNSAIIGHGWLNVYPPITNLAGSVTVTFPAKPSPESFWRLKQRAADILAADQTSVSSAGGTRGSTLHPRTTHHFMNPTQPRGKRE